MPRAITNAPIPMGLLVSCLRHAKQGQVSRTHGGIYVRRNGHKQIRTDKEAKELLRREWLREVDEKTDTGQTITMLRLTEAGTEAIEVHLAARTGIVEASTVE